MICGSYLHQAVEDAPGHPLVSPWCTPRPLGSGCVPPQCQLRIPEIEAGHEQRSSFSHQPNKESFSPADETSPCSSLKVAGDLGERWGPVDAPYASE
jgi:hypothetical protein